jgi:mannosyltransferase
MVDTSTVNRGPSAQALTEMAAKRLALWPVLLWTAIAAALRLWHLGQESLWFDEAYSIWVAQGPMWDLATLLAWKVPFPAYYVLLHGWIKLFGSGPVALRLLSVVAGVLTVPVFWQLLLRRFNPRVAVWGAALLALSPLHIWYSQEGRQYALTILLTTLAANAFGQAISPPPASPATNPAQSPWRLWAGYVVWGALALYTHYYAGLVLASFGLVGIWASWQRRSWRLFGNLAAANGAILLLFLPGLVAPLSQAGGGTWNWVAAKYGIPGWRTLYDLAGAFTYGTLFDPALAIKLTLLMLAGVLLVVALCRWGNWPTVRTNASGDRLSLLLLVAWAGGAPLLAFCVSQFAPLFLTRYLLPALPGYLALLAVGLASLEESRQVAWARSGLVVGGMLLAASFLAVLPLYAGGHKEDWRGVAQTVAAREQAGDVVLLVDEDINVPFNYYYQGHAPQFRLWRGVTEPAEIAAKLQPLLDQYRRLWFVHSHAPGEAAKKWLLSAPGLTLRPQATFQGVELFLFEISHP